MLRSEKGHLIFTASLIVCSGVHMSETKENNLEPSCYFIFKLIAFSKFSNKALQFISEFKY